MSDATASARPAATVELDAGDLPAFCPNPGITI